MKKSIVFLIASGLFFIFLWFTSCHSSVPEPELKEPKDEPIEEPKVEIKDMKLRVFSGDSKDANTDSVWVMPELNSLELLFTGDDIRSYNLTTGEFIFHNITNDELIAILPTYSKVFFYLDDQLLFDPPFYIYNWFASIRHPGYGMHVLFTVYLSDYRPKYDWLTGDELEKRLKADEEIYKRQEKEMAVFIKYLRDNKKIIE